MPSCPNSKFSLCKSLQCTYTNRGVIIVDNKFNDATELPAGLKMALTQNLDALNKFTGLPANQQSAFVEGARQVQSKQEMQSYVDHLIQS